MRRNSLIISVVLFITCFTFIYTFPLHRKSVTSKGTVFQNASMKCYNPFYRDSAAKQFKKKSSNIGNSLKKFKESTQDFGKNIYNQVNSGLKSVAANINPVSAEDISHYERLVLLKKYPFMDLMQYESRFRPFNKNTRQSVMVPEQTNFDNGAAICELMDEAHNVEITNRGLSGFAIPIPTQLTKNVNNLDKTVMIISNADTSARLDGDKIFDQEHSALGSLKNEVMEYVEQKIKNT